MLDSRRRFLHRIRLLDNKVIVTSRSGFLFSLFFLRSFLAQIFNSSPSKSSRVSKFSTGSVSGHLKLQGEHSESKKRMRIRSKPIRAILNEEIFKKDFNVIHLSNHEARQLQSFSAENTVYVTLSAFQNRLKEDEDALSVITKEYGNSSTFCLGHGPWALAHATRKISLDNFMDERDKENSSKFLPSQRIFSASIGNNKSRLYHPGGSLKFSRPDIPSNLLPRSREFFQGSSYLFPGTGNMVPVRLVDTSNN